MIDDEYDSPIDLIDQHASSIEDLQEKVGRLFMLFRNMDMRLRKQAVINMSQHDGGYQPKANSSVPPSEAKRPVGGSFVERPSAREAMSKIWELRPLDKFLPADHADKLNPWHYPYDGCVFGLIVIAESEHEARRLANENGGPEIHMAKPIVDVWLNPNYTSCNELKAEGLPHVVMKE